MVKRGHKYWKRDPEWTPMWRTKQEWLPITPLEYHKIGLKNFARKHPLITDTIIGATIGVLVWGVAMATKILFG